MSSYRKKPVVVNAWLFDGSYESYAAVPSGGMCRWFSKGLSGRPPCVEIQTLEGTMTAMPGDYIIRGIKGEFYPCKPDIFEATYEPAAAVRVADGEGRAHPDLQSVVSEVLADMRRAAPLIHTSRYGNERAIARLVTQWANTLATLPVQQAQPEAVGDLLAYGEEEATAALKRKDRDQYQFWQGWNAALQRVSGGAVPPREDR